MTRAATILEPYTPKSLQANATHTAESEQSLALQTAGLIVRGAQHAVAKSFASPDHAPYIDVQATQTWYPFVYGDESDEGHVDEFHLPYYQQLGFKDLFVEVRLVTSIGMAMGMRITTDDLPGISSGASQTQSAAIQLNSYAHEQLGLAQWITYDWQGATPRAVVIRKRTRDLDASSIRWLSMKPEIRLKGATSALFDVSGDWRIYMESIRMCGIYDEREYGDG